MLVIEKSDAQSTSLLALGLTETSKSFTLYGSNKCIYYVLHIMHLTEQHELCKWADWYNVKYLEIHFLVNKHLCSIELGSIKCNPETAKIGILPWENMSTTIAKLPKSDFAHL